MVFAKNLRLAALVIMFTVLSIGLSWKDQPMYAVLQLPKSGQMPEFLSCTLQELAGANYAQFIRQQRPFAISRLLAGLLAFSFSPVAMRELSLIGNPATSDEIPKGEFLMTLDPNRPATGQFNPATRELRIDFTLVLKFAKAEEIRIPAEFLGTVSSSNEVVSGRIVGTTKATTLGAEITLLVVVYSVCERTEPRKGQTGEKRGKKPRDIQGLPTKGKTEPLPPEKRITMKLPPEKVEPGKSTGAGGTKVPPEQIIVVPPGIGSKQEKKAEPTKERYGRVRFSITLTTSTTYTIKIERAFVLEGELLEPSTVDGEFIYSISRRVATVETLVSVGSMQDPLLVRSYQEGGGHSVGRTKDGNFLISIPGKLLTKEILSETTIRFFLLPPDAPVPQVLTPQTFPQFGKFLNQIGETKGDELVKAFEGILPPP